MNPLPCRSCSDKLNLNSLEGIFPLSFGLVLCFFILHSSAISELLTVSADNAHVGALTDGRTWKFFYILDDHFYQTTIVADSDENLKQILGMLGYAGF